MIIGNIVKVAEKDVLAACLTYLNMLPGVIAWRQQTGAMKAVYKGKKRFVRFGPKGQADITGMVQGVRMEVECKATGKTPSDKQTARMRLILDQGGIAFWCDSLEMCSTEMKRVFEERGLNWRKDWEI